MKRDIKGHKPDWPPIPNYPYRILIVRGLGSRKTNPLLNIINQRSCTIKFIYMLKICMKQDTNF